jgi:hypothetical protein
MLALVGTVMLRSAFGKVLLREGDGVLGTHTSARVSQFLALSLVRGAW